MFSIKQSKANCMQCPLLNSNSCIEETNCSKDLSKVDVIFIAENPGKDEIAKGVPLIGRAGQLFRKYFNKYKLNKQKYFLTNVVLCATINPDGTTGNPSPEVINICKKNCFAMIELINPKLIVLMGTSPMSAFGIANSGITNYRGQYFKWNDRDVFITVHPSFVNRQKKYEDKFESDIAEVSRFLGSDISKFKTQTKIKKGNKGIYYYKIPDRFYTEDYKLIDIQYLRKTSEVLYMFREKDDKKIYHKEKDKYVCYQLDKDIIPEPIIKYDNLHQIEIPYMQKYGLDSEITYEGDMKIEVKHAIDYFLKNKGELKANLKTLFLDIEVYVPTKDFPNSIDAAYPICLITYYLEGECKTYVLDNKILLKDNKLSDINISDDVKVFKTEKELLNTFIKDFRNLDVDVVTGWNVINFDIAYIVNRCLKLNISPSQLSKFGEVDADPQKMYADVAGVIILDMLDLYKSFTFGEVENYRLGTIARNELGEDKLDVGESFADKFRSDVNGAIDYNIRDVMLLVKLDKKLKHINLREELRNICKSSFSGSKSPMGQIDSLIISYLKEKGMSTRNSNSEGKHEKLVGAYVKEPIKGIHNWIVDFDFTSLYPSLILTYNIGINTLEMKFSNMDMMYDFIYNQESLPEKIEMVIDPIKENKNVIINKQDLIDKVKSENLTYTINGCFYKSHSKELSFYSEIINFLLAMRKDFQKLLNEAIDEKNKEKEELYDTRQLVIKVLSNALYGVLGNGGFRFFNLDCAKSITLSGQEGIKTSIIEADTYAQYIKKRKNKDEIKDINPKVLSKKEVYGELERNIDYVITSDTDSIFVTYEKIIDRKKTYEETIENVNDMNNEIQTFLNEEVVNKLVLKHNVPLDRNRLNLKNELVAKRGLYVTKKHYANYILFKKEKPVNKVVSVGLDTKRSDYSKYTKECLEELLKLILESEKFSIIKLNEFIKEKEIEFLRLINIGSKDVSRPSSFVKKLDQYKTLSQHIKAMLNWNKLMYNAFDKGSKGYMFKIKGIDQTRAPKEVIEKYHKEFLSKGKKLEVICIPDEEKALPDYIIPDKQKMLEFHWTDRYTNLLESVIEVKSNIMTI